MLPERWIELQPVLDAALDGDTHSRTALLQDLDRKDPDLAQRLRALLSSHEQAQGEGFLQQTPDSGLFASPLTGQRLGPWTLLQALGEGGMGSVWLARRDDGRFEGQAAVKLLNLTLPNSARAGRFRQEGHILARLTHPHIAHLLDAGVTPSGQPYLVLEHVQGLAIDGHCDTHRLDVEARIRLFLTLLEAVAHAHHHLIVHRDIKPSNVMVSQDGQLKLLDFGIAKMLDRNDTAGSRGAGLTQQAGAMLSPGYAAPEQLQGGDITTATDVYALGVLLFGLLSGQHPTLRAGTPVAQALRQMLDQEAPRLSTAVAANEEAASPRATRASQLQRQLRGDLDNIVAKALQRDPARRYVSVQAFADDLQRHLSHQPVLARTPGLGYRLWRFVQRQRVPVAVAAAGLAALGVVGAQAWQQQQAARLNDTRAQTVDGLLQSLFRGMSPDVAASRSFSARELLDRGQAYLDQGSTLDAASRSSARLRMAGLYRDIGAYPQAAQAYAAEAREAAQDGDTRRHVLALWNAADVQLKLRDFAAVEKTLKTMAPLIQTRLADDTELDARQAVLQGELLLGTGRFAQAEEAYARADAKLAAVHPPDLELQARSAKDHGWSARLSGHIEDAGRHLRRAAELYRQQGDSATVDRLGLEVQIAALDNWSGRYQEASQRLSAVYEELVSRLGPQHALPVLATSELAVAELRQGHFAPARTWLGKLRGSTGPGDRWRDGYANALEARIKLYEGRSAQAEPELKALLATKEAEEGRPSGQTEPLRRLHGEALLRLGRADAAQAVLRGNETRLIALNQTAQHNSVAATQVLLGCALARSGDLTGAAQLWGQAAPLLARQLGPQHPYSLAAAAYAALSDPASSSTERQALAERVQQELGWQDGAAQLAQWLRTRPQSVDWARLPTVL